MNSVYAGDAATREAYAKWVQLLWQDKDAQNARLLATFEANLELLPGASGDPKTMEWWATQPEAWAAARERLQEPAVAMARYVEWLAGLPGKLM